MTVIATYTTGYKYFDQAKEIFKNLFAYIFNNFLKMFRYLLSSHIFLVFMLHFSEKVSFKISLKI